MKFYRTKRVSTKGVYTYQKNERIILHLFQRRDRLYTDRAGDKVVADAVIVTLANIGRDETIMDENGKIYKVIDVNASPIGLNRYQIKADGKV